MSFVRYADYPVTDAARAYESRMYQERVDREHAECEHNQEHEDLRVNMTRYRGHIVSRVQAVWYCDADRKAGR